MPELRTNQTGMCEELNIWTVLLSLPAAEFSALFRLHFSDFQAFAVPAGGDKWNSLWSEAKSDRTGKGSGDCFFLALVSVFFSKTGRTRNTQEGHDVASFHSSGESLSLSLPTTWSSMLLLLLVPLSRAAAWESSCGVFPMLVSIRHAHVVSKCLESRQMGWSRVCKWLSSLWFQGKS